MARNRSKSNEILPPYVMRRGHRFYFEPKGEMISHFGGKKSFPLGGSYPEMFILYKSLLDKHDVGDCQRINTMDQLLDRYLVDVSPKKAPSTHESEVKRAKKLKKVFGQMSPSSVTTLHVYQYLDWSTTRGGPTGANRELSLLADVFKKAVRWGVVEQNPVLDVERNVELPRERYISDKELKDFVEYTKDRFPVVSAYVEFKYVTGLRFQDIKHLELSQIGDDGISLTISKTKTKCIFVWTPKFREITDRLKTVCRSRGKWPIQSEYLLCARSGAPYTDSGWRANFRRAMKSALDQGVISESFRDHDVRAKAGSDHKTREAAQKFLVHSDSKVTERHYRRKPKIIKPLL